MNALPILAPARACSRGRHPEPACFLRPRAAKSSPSASCVEVLRATAEHGQSRHLKNLSRPSEWLTGTSATGSQAVLPRADSADAWRESTRRMWMLVRDAELDRDRNRRLSQRCGAVWRRVLGERGSVPPTDLFQPPRRPSAGKTLRRRAFRPDRFDQSGVCSEWLGP